jgi:hypothetical protein
MRATRGQCEEPRTNVASHECWMGGKQARGRQLQITNKLRLRRAAHGSGEHRRTAYEVLKDCRQSRPYVRSSSLAAAPASQL